jgi:hypothetical protein
MGVLTTYCVEPHRPDALRLRMLEILSQQVADILDQVRSAPGSGAPTPPGEGTVWT